jgi:hypothetical protein
LCDTNYGANAYKRFTGLPPVSVTADITCLKTASSVGNSLGAAAACIYYQARLEADGVKLCDGACTRGILLG